MAKRLKILISAYACEPDRGSEPEVGWQTSMHLAQLHDVTVLTRSNNRGPIERGIEGRTGRTPDFLYYDPPAWLLWLKRRGLPTFVFYFFWQLGARLHMRGKLDDFDLIHHCTFNSYRQPGFWWLTGKTVVLGPLGGGQICPWRMLPWFRKQLFFEIVRSLTVLCGYVMPQIFTGFLSARRIMVANADTYRALPWFFRGKAIRMLETALLPEDTRDVDRSARTGPVRILWMSRMDKLKGGELAIRAFAQAAKTNKDMRLTFAGGGPEEAPLQRLIRKLKIESRVDWLGRVPKQEVTQLMADHNIFVFTSLRDTSGNVMLEAMGTGLPVVCIGHHGALEISTEETAIRVSGRSRHGVVNGIAVALGNLGADAALRKQMGDAGLRRVREKYLWPQQAARLDEVFQAAHADQRVLNKVVRKPFEAIFSIRGVFMLLVVSLVIAVFEMAVVWALEKHANHVATGAVPALVQIADANAALTESFNNVLLAVASSDPAARQAYQSKAADLSITTTRSLEAFSRALPSAGSDPLFLRLVEKRSRFLEIRGEVFATLDRGARSDALAAYESKLLPAYNDYKPVGDELLSRTAESGKSSAASLILVFRMTLIALVVAGVVIFTFGFAVGFSR